MQKLKSFRLWGVGGTYGEWAVLMSTRKLPTQNTEISCFKSVKMYF